MKSSLRFFSHKDNKYHKKYVPLHEESGEKLGKIDVTAITLSRWFYCSDLYPQSPAKYITYWSKGHIRNKLLCYVNIHFPLNKYGCDIFETDGECKVDSLYPFPFEDRNVKISVTKREKV